MNCDRRPSISFFSRKVGEEAVGWWRRKAELRSVVPLLLNCFTHPRCAHYTRETYENPQLERLYHRLPKEAQSPRGK